MAEPAEIPVIAYEQLVSDLQAGSVVLVDVRNPDELVSQGKIPGSVNIPLPQVPDSWKNLSDDEFKNRFGFTKTNSGKKLVFSCRAGTRAKAAIDNLVGLGIQNQYVLYSGSFNDWEKHGGALEEPKK